ncbi:imidazole glycerol phosphate synthase subunit HisH [Microcystis elabens FACHB-917]|nr:imidazole glycerol phosphate synthase subunit HisH [Microcystis elabens FACHB-917]
MIAVIDYGLGNVRSVLNAFEYIGAQAVLTRDPKELGDADGMILPGVGAFGEGMRRLAMHQLREPILTLVSEGRPLLGICLGFQMLMQSSTELGTHDGLALIEEQIIRLPVHARLPHIGWARVIPASDTPGKPRLLEGLEGQAFYFVHSYGLVKPACSLPYAIAVYAGCEITALVEDGNVFGTQFHPEKSGEAGLQMLRNFMSICL